MSTSCSSPASTTRAAPPPPEQAFPIRRARPSDRRGEVIRAMGHVLHGSVQGDPGAGIGYYLGRGAGGLHGGGALPSFESIRPLHPIAIQRGRTENAYVDLHAEDVARSGHCTGCSCDTSRLGRRIGPAEAQGSGHLYRAGGAAVGVADPQGAERSQGTTARSSTCSPRTSATPTTSASCASTPSRATR